METKLQGRKGLILQISKQTSLHIGHLERCGAALTPWEIITEAAEHAQALQNM